MQHVGANSSHRFEEISIWMMKICYSFISDVFRNQLNIYDEAYSRKIVNYFAKSPIIGVQLGSKYASEENIQTWNI